jgi:hypothetical protein
MPEVSATVHELRQLAQEPHIMTPFDPRASHRRPWWRQGALPQSNPFGALGLAWCVHCKQEVDVDTEAHHEGTLYVWRQRCLRCGRYSNFGVYQNVPLGGNPGIPTMALERVFEPGKDRR